MQKKEKATAEKTFSSKAVLTLSLVCLVAGFLGGIVFSAFKMEGGIQEMTTMVATEGTESTPELTEAQAEEIGMLERAAEASADNADAWIALGNACFDYNQPQKAIHAYETALAIAPENADVSTDLGTAYRISGDPQKAISLYERAQEISPGHEMSLLNAGIVYLHDLNDPESAIVAWEELLKVDPTATTAGGMLIQNLVTTLKSQM